MLYVLLSIVVFALANAQFNVEKLTSVYDRDLYEKVLNKDQCKKQIGHMIRTNTFLLSRFLDASARVPTGMYGGNMADLGNYYQCLEINEPYNDSKIEGKYCVIKVPVYQEIFLPGFPNSVKLPDIDSLKLGPVPTWILGKYKIVMEDYLEHMSQEGISPSNPFTNYQFHLGVCIPRVCTVKEAVSKLYFNLNLMGFAYNEVYCRLPNDKPWGIADNIAVFSFTLIIFLTLLSTIYELIYIFVLKRDEKNVDVYWRSFSLYNNTRLLLHFPQNPDSLRCLHGIKVVSLFSIICLNAFTSYAVVQNHRYKNTWLISNKISTLLTIAEIYADTFFVITGILLVYLVANKMDSMSLLKNIHLFYLQKLLRILPLLVTAIIFDTSVFHKIADGPMWTQVALNAQWCRNSWWPTVLQYQNYLHPREMCLKHSWYVALEVQLHILSPLLLFWLVNGSRKNAWVAIVAALGAVLSTSAIRNHTKNCPASLYEQKRTSEFFVFLTKYYHHIMSRMAPFLVGMIVGYVLHLWRRKKIRINKILVCSLWLMTFGVISLTVYIHWLLKQDTWDNPPVDNILNTLLRPAWAAAIGWMVVACVHGYGGPINWILSLDMWQLPSRLTYGMYLFFHPIMDVVESSGLNPGYFSVVNTMYRFMGLLIMSFVVSLVLNVLIEVPLKIWFKRLLDRCTVVPHRRRRFEIYDIYELASSKEYD